MCLSFSKDKDCGMLLKRILENLLMKKTDKNSYERLLTYAAQEEKHKGGWRQYPRPQLVRKGYMILDEDWKLDGHPIRVPFPPQSVLSDYWKLMAFPKWILSLTASVRIW